MEIENTNIPLEETPNHQTDEVAGNDPKKEIDYKLLEKIFFVLSKIPQKTRPRRLNRARVNTKNILPTYEKHWTNTGLSFKQFLYNTLLSVFSIPLHFHWGLLMLSSSIIRYRSQMMTSQFVVKLGTKRLLSLEEASPHFFRQIIDTTTIFIFYMLILWLLVPLHPVLQLFIMLMLIAAPCYYVPELAGQASGIRVTWGSFKMPLIWFIASGALLLYLIFVFLSLLVIYLIRRYIHPGEQTVKEVDVSWNAISDIFEEC